MTIRQKLVFACTAWVIGMVSALGGSILVLAWTQDLAGMLLGLFAVTLGIVGLTAGATLLVSKRWLEPTIHELTDRVLEVRHAEHECDRYDKEQRMIADYADACTQFQDPVELYRTLTTQMARAVGASVCFIMRYEKSVNRMVARIPGFGVSDHALKSAQYVVTPEVKAAWNFSTQGSLLSNDPLSDRRVLSQIASLIGLFNCVVVPFFFQGRVTGLIVAGNKLHWFTHDDVRILTALASHTSLAVANQELQNGVRRSIRDPLTTLFTAHHFRTLLEQEAESESPTSSGYAVLAIAVDDFQTCLDVYGRQGANRVLKEVAARLASIAPNSPAARQGGHEFTVLCPQTSRDDASAHAEAIRRVVESAPVAVDTGIPFSVTVSVGVASSHDHGPPDTVLYAAQGALRHARRGGRNSVVTAGVEV